MRFIPESEAGALRAHLDKELGGPVTLDLFIESKSAILVPGRSECELCEETRQSLQLNVQEDLALTSLSLRLRRLVGSPG